jgi:hypothetical protein
MTKATPEQIRLFRHRRMVLIFGIIGILVAGFLLMVSLLSLSALNRNGKVAIVVGFSTVLLTGIGMTIFKFMYYRCPICGHPIPSRAIGPRGRGITIGSRCDKCEVDFAA